MQKKKKVFFFTSSPSGGGAEKQLIKIHDSIKESYGCSFFVAKDSSKISYIKSFNKKRTSFSFFNLLKELGKFKPDILFTTLPTPNFLNVFFKKIFRFKYISVVRIAHYNLNLKTTKFIIKNSNIVLFNSYENMNLYKQNFRKSSGKFYYLNNIVDEFDNVHDSKDSSSNIVRGIVASSLAHRKGIDVLIKAVNKIEDTNFFVDIYGTGPEYEYLKGILKNPNIKIMNKSVDLHNIWKEYDMFLLPSRSEGLSNSLLEAQANNLFSIVSDCLTGNKEILELTNNGILFESENYLDLKLKIENFLNLQYSKTNSRKAIISNFSKIKVQNTLNNLFN